MGFKSQFQCHLRLETLWKVLLFGYCQLFRVGRYISLNERYAFAETPRSEDV